VTATRPQPPAPPTPNKKVRAAAIRDFMLTQLENLITNHNDLAESFYANPANARNGRYVMNHDNVQRFKSVVEMVDMLDQVAQ